MLKTDTVQHYRYQALDLPETSIEATEQTENEALLLSKT